MRPVPTYGERSRYSRHAATPVGPAPAPDFIAAVKAVARAWDHVVSGLGFAFVTRAAEADVWVTWSGPAAPGDGIAGAVRGAHGG